MQMSEGDIVKIYRESAVKKHQITILDDLNCCSREYIIEILEKNGVLEKEAPKKAKKSETKKTTKKSDEKPKMTESVNPPWKCDNCEPLSTDEQKLLSKIFMPDVVRSVMEERIASITVQVIALEKERDLLCSYLNGGVEHV